MSGDSSGYLGLIRAPCVPLFVHGNVGRRGAMRGALQVKQKALRMPANRACIKPGNAEILSLWLSKKCMRVSETWLTQDAKWALNNVLSYFCVAGSWLSISLKNIPLHFAGICLAKFIMCHCCLVLSHLVFWGCIVNSLIRKSYEIVYIIQSLIKHSHLMDTLSNPSISLRLRWTTLLSSSTSQIRVIGAWTPLGSGPTTLQKTNISRLMALTLTD